MTDIGIAEEYAPLITEQKRADAVAAREEAAAELHHAAQALIPLQNRLDAIPDEDERATGPKPQCVFCDTTTRLTFRAAKSAYGRDYHVCVPCAGDVNADRRDDDRDYADLTSA